MHGVTKRRVTTFAMVLMSVGILAWGCPEHGNGCSERGDSSTDGKLVCSFPKNKKANDRYVLKWRYVNEADSTSVKKMKNTNG